MQRCCRSAANGFQRPLWETGTASLAFCGCCEQVRSTCIFDVAFDFTPVRLRSPCQCCTSSVRALDFIKSFFCHSDIRAGVQISARMHGPGEYRVSCIWRKLCAVSQHFSQQRRCTFTSQAKGETKGKSSLYGLPTCWPSRSLWGVHWW